MNKNYSHFFEKIHAFLVLTSERSFVIFLLLYKQFKHKIVLDIYEHVIFNFQSFLH